ncbi:MAG: disulfide bond formation protein B [Rhodobacterales bacterium]|nr:MAG: disulfide bond formation protein B [Rhodobacterales bacterium]
MTLRDKLILVAAGGSLGALLGAFGFQYIGEMPPCELCIWQRWPHGVAVVAGILALLLRCRMLALVGMLGALTTSMIGFYHAGVEQKWWPGPSSCTGGDISGLSTQELLDHIMAAPLVRCDEIPWEMFGLSMAAWNGIASLGLAVIWGMAFRAR